MRTKMALIALALAVQAPAAAQDTNTSDNGVAAAPAATDPALAGTTTNAAATPGVQTAPLPPETTPVASPAAQPRSERDRRFPWGLLGLLGLVGLLGSRLRRDD